MSPALHRVAITGMGCISGLGHDADSHWQACRDGRSGVETIRQVDPARLNIKVCAEVKDFDPASHFPERQLNLLDRVSQFAVYAARQALADSALELDSELMRRTAVVLGTGAGGMNTLDNQFWRLYGEGNRRVMPLTVPRLMVSAAASHVTMDAKIMGPAFMISSACSSANHAIGEAFWMIRTGRARAAVTGGTEACLTYGTIRGWEALRVMTPDVCRPFSHKRRGMLLGEGAGVFVLERLEDARARGAKIYAELAGMGMSSDAGDIVFPSEEGAAAAITGALEDAGLAPEEIDYINAHGTGTAANDVTETRAIRRALGAAADKVPVSSTKGVHGHALGGAGALELVAAVRAITDQVIPPTANYLEPDPDCDLDYVPNQARPAAVRTVLSNSFAFGGLNAVLAVRAVD